MEAVIKNEAQPLYIVDSIYSPTTESDHLTKSGDPIDAIAFPGMADPEGQREHKELEQHFDHGQQVHWETPHSRRVDRNAYAVDEVRRLAWDDWNNQSNNTLFDHNMDDYANDLWTEMTQMEWDSLAPRETNRRANWYDISPELRDRLNRLNEYETDGLPFIELSVTQAWLARYEHERNRLD